MNEPTPARNPATTQGCSSPTACPSSTTPRATAAPSRPAPRASPTASSTTGPAPGSSSPPCAVPPVPARSASTASATSSSSSSSSASSTPASRCSRSAPPSNQLRESGIDDLAQTTLMSDGASVYLCTSNDEVIDLVSRGQGVFGIAVGKVLREVETARRDRHAAVDPPTSSPPAAPRGDPRPVRPRGPLASRQPSRRTPDARARSARRRSGQRGRSRSRRCAPCA